MTHRINRRPSRRGSMSGQYLLVLLVVDTIQIVEELAHVIRVYTRIKTS